MILDRPLLFLDTETTGVDPCADYVIELGVTVLWPDGSVNPRGWSCRFKPPILIPAAATEVHGITDEMLADCKPFANWAPRLHERLKGKDLAGYNLRRLDLPILDEEFRRCGLKLDLSGVRVIDVQAIYFKANPRTLADAVKQYCGRDHTDAHGAGADAEATMDVWLQQLVAHQDIPDNMDGMAEYARLGDYVPVDIAGKLYRDAEGFVCFAFGKNKDKRVADQKGYASWMISKDFPRSTLDALDAELSRLERGT